LIRLLLGLTEANSGQMRLLGLPVPELRGAALARVGAIVEEPPCENVVVRREPSSCFAPLRRMTCEAMQEHHRTTRASKVSTDKTCSVSF
jgi:ABC-type multidrug transport system ATPase subunit